MAYPTKILIGDRVRWHSSAGTKRGEVINIFDAMDELGDVINFYHIEYHGGFNDRCLAMIAEDEITKVDLKVTFRDHGFKSVMSDYDCMVEQVA
jgi:hypothetical protein